MLRRLSRPLALATAAASFAAHAHGRSLSSEPARLRPILFFGDLDGTVLGGEAALGAFAEYWRRVESPAGSILCYNTGRCITQYFEGFETGLAGMHLGRPLRGELPVPDVLITGDGTEVRWCVDTAAREPDFVLDDEWDALIRMSWWGSGLRERVLRHIAQELKKAPDLVPQQWREEVDEAAGTASLDECPICFLSYPCLNRSRCCGCAR